MLIFIDDGDGEELTIEYESDFDFAFDAMALWEAWLEPEFSGLRDKLTEKMQGTCAVRSIFADLTPYCSLLHRIACDDDTDGTFDDSFDWDWCPWFINNCLSHEDLSIKKDWRDIGIKAWCHTPEN